MKTRHLAATAVITIATMAASIASAQDVVMRRPIPRTGKDGAADTPTTPTPAATSTPDEGPPTPLGDPDQDVCDKGADSPTAQISDVRWVESGWSAGPGDGTCSTQTMGYTCQATYTCALQGVPTTFTSTAPDSTCENYKGNVSYPAGAFVWRPGYSESPSDRMTYFRVGSPVSAGGGTQTGFTGLTRGQKVVSQNGRYELRMQYDGNLVEYRTANGSVLWAGNYSGDRVRLALMPSGRIQVQRNDGGVIVEAGYDGANPTMVLQNDGHWVIYYSNRGAWATGAYDR